MGILDGPGTPGTESHCCVGAWSRGPEGGELGGAPLGLPRVCSGPASHAAWGQGRSCS